ncbi:MAG TPA: FAD-binding oxidoreductase [Dehalococcoidales bacterium]|nr:FAD-binding oxidoreductase [Dehalococcoidales bacterium]
MNRRDKLVEIVGVENFSDDPKALETYAKDFSLLPAGAPEYAVKPKDTQEVQKVIKVANDHSLPVVPVSSWVHFYGAAIPKKGGIILDLTRMNRIFEVDDFNRRVRFEAGVTWEQLTDHLEEKGFRVMMPLLPHPQRSVLTDNLEREVITNTVYDYGEPMQSMEVVWPNAEVFRTGSASVMGYPDSPSKGANPSGPGLDFYRFLQAAQGTMGVVTWTNLKTEYITQKDKMFLAPVKDLNEVMEFLYRILRIRIGQECLLLNNTDLAAIMATDMKKEFASLRSSLPPWTLILVISGHYRNPEGKIKYEEKTLNDIIKNEFPEISFGDNLPGLPGSGEKLLGMLRKPWPKEITYWKNRSKGGCHSLFFITKPTLAPKFIEKMESMASRHGCPESDLGSYIQPIEHNRACQVEFNLFYDPTSRPEVERVRTLASEAAKTLFDQGALFSRPYGEWANMVYDRANGYAAILKRVKKLFDPNNIMNPGNLCF